MDDESYDPYDLSNYVQPMKKAQPEKVEKESEEKNIKPTPTAMKKPPTKRVFNPYEKDDGDKTDESQPLKKQRKLTDENLPQNIDLTQNAYEDKPYNQTGTSDNKPLNDDDEDIPLLEDLGINLQNIKKKIISILTIHRIDKKFLQESDLAGPFFIFAIFTFSLILQKKTCFGSLYGISVFGSVLLFLLMNLMSKKSAILLYDTISVLGYCLIPVVILSFIAVFITMKGLIGGVLCFLIIIVASISATRFFEIALDMSEQKWLIFYPVSLFYTCFVLVSIF